MAKKFKSDNLVLPADIAIHSVTFTALLHDKINIPCPIHMSE